MIGTTLMSLLAVALIASAWPLAAISVQLIPDATGWFTLGWLTLVGLVLTACGIVLVAPDHTLGLGIPVLAAGAVIAGKCTYHWTML